MATIHPNFSTPVTTLSTNVPTTLTDSESTTTNSNAPQAKIDNLTISGKALMLSRLFHTDDIYVTPKIEYSTTTRNTSGLVYNFLTASDREILARIYEYASNNGTDLDQVDHLAFDLACYRMAGASGGNRDTTGMITDNEGRVLISHFSQEDTATAKRILTSDAMKDTAIDREFLLTLMNPGKSQRMRLTLTSWKKLSLLFLPLVLPILKMRVVVYQNRLAQTLPSCLLA